MFHPKQLLQIRLSTVLLLLTVLALGAMGIRRQMDLDNLESKVEMYEEHLPEYNIERQIRQLEAEWEQAKEFNGEASSIARRLEIEIRKLKQQKKSEAISAGFKNRPLPAGWTRATPTVPPSNQPNLGK